MKSVWFNPLLLNQDPNLKIKVNLVSRNLVERVEQLSGYRDEQGRELTAKEAYRRISYAFHGQAPSKTTRDKRLKRQLREEKLAAGGAASAANTAVIAQQRALEAKGQAFLSLGK